MRLGEGVFNTDSLLSSVSEGAHGAKPHLGKDAIVIASELISQYQNIISRNIDPLQPSVVTIGKMEAGEVRNVIPKSAHLEGTIRAFNNDALETIIEKINKINKGLEIANDVEIKTTITRGYPVVDNDKQLCENIKSYESDNNYVDVELVMFSDDFGFFNGLYLLTGIRMRLKEICDFGTVTRFILGFVSYF